MTRGRAYESLMSRLIQTIRISRSFPGLQPACGVAQAGNVRMSCILGRSGVVVRKKEGDGGTPYGDFSIMGGYFRPDREKRPSAQISLRPTRTSDGWCDDPTSFRYNTPVKLPTRLRCERLTLPDNVYDIVLTTDHNQRPRTLGAGSAIFVHFRRPDGRGTEGCIAFAPEDLRRLLPRLGKRVRLIIR